MHRYGGAGGGSDSRLLIPQKAESGLTSTQRFLLEGPYHDQTLGPPSSQSASSSHGSRGHGDFVVGEEFAVDEGIVPRLSVMDAAAIQLQMLNINNGAGERVSTSGPYCLPYRPTPTSPAYANPIYSPRFQSAVLSHRSVNGTGSFHGFSGEIDGNGIARTNMNYFLHNGHIYPPNFESSVLNHHTEYHPSGSSLLHDACGEIDVTVRTNTSCVWSNGHNGTASWSQVPVYSSITSLQGRIVELACHQQSCKSLQKTIEQGLDEEEIEILFEEIIDYIAVLMKHRYANYVVQQLIEVCSEQQWYIIVSTLTKGAPQIIDICCNQHGTRVIQKLLDNAKTPHQRSALLLAIAPNVVELTKNAYGQYVILHCLEKFSDEDNELLYAEVANNCFDIAIDKDGCCAMQKYVDFAQGNQRKLIVDAITAQALYLSMDFYGNYVVQHILNLKIPQATACLISQLKGGFLILSCDKFSSNVVESCMRESGKDQFAIIIDELLSDPRYMEVFLDQYGNFVFTSAVDVSKKKGLFSIFNTLQAIIQENAELMNGHFYGKKALARLEKKKLLLPHTIAALHRF